MSEVTRHFALAMPDSKARRIHIAVAASGLMVKEWLERAVLDAAESEMAKSGIVMVEKLRPPPSRARGDGKRTPRE